MQKAANVATSVAGKAAMVGGALGIAGDAANAADAVAMAMGAAMGKDPCVPPGTLGAITTGVPTVLIGGFPMPSWTNVAKGLGKLAKGIRRKVGSRGRGRAGTNHG